MRIILAFIVTLYAVTAALELNTTISLERVHARNGYEEEKETPRDESSGVCGDNLLLWSFNDENATLTI